MRISVDLPDPLWPITPIWRLEKAEPRRLEKHAPCEQPLFGTDHLKDIFHHAKPHLLGTVNNRTHTVR